MSDTVNEYGLGSPNTQASEPLLHDSGTDPLAHGLGSRDVTHDNHGDEDVDLRRPRKVEGWMGAR